MFRPLLLLLLLPSLAMAQRHVKLEGWLAEGKVKKVQKLTERALQRKPDDGNVILVKAKLQNLAGEYHKAIATAGSAMNKGCDAQQATLVIGIAEAGLGHYSEAIRMIVSIPEKDRNDETQYQLALAFAGDGRTEDALKVFDQLINKAPENYQAYRERGTVYAEMGDSTKAHADLDHAIAIAPKDPVNWNSRGYQHWARHGMHDRAVSDYNKAIKINVNYAFAFNNRGWSRYELGDKVKGLKDMRSSHKKRPNNPYVHYNYARIALAAGEVNKACEQFRKAEALNIEKKFGMELVKLIDDNCVHQVIPETAGPGSEPVEKEQKPPARGNAPGKR